MHAERVLLTGSLLLGVIFMISGWHLDFRADIAFGPGFVPLLAAAGLILCCAIQLLRRKPDTATASEFKTGEREAATQQSSPDYRALLIAITILVAGTLSMALGSLLGSAFAMTALLSWLVSGHSLIRSVLVAMAVIAAIYVIFAIWLGLPIH